MSKNSQKQAFENIKPMKSSEFRKLYYAILRSLDRIERKTIQIAALCNGMKNRIKNLIIQNNDSNISATQSYRLSQSDGSGLKKPNTIRQQI